MKKALPKFKSSDEEALFWEKHEILNYVDKDEFKVVNPQSDKRFRFQKKAAVSPPKELISMRVGIDLIDRAKAVAERQQKGYLAILRGWLEKGAAS